MVLFKNDRSAQSTLEFTFAIIAIMLFIYGMVHIFRWAGIDLAQRRYLMDTGITANVVHNSDNPNGDPSSQLNFAVEDVQPMAAVYRGNVSDGNTSQ